MPPKKKASRSIATERAAEKSKPEKASRSIATERAAEKSKPQALNTQSCALELGSNVGPDRPVPKAKKARSNTERVEGIALEKHWSPGEMDIPPDEKWKLMGPEWLNNLKKATIGTRMHSSIKTKGRMLGYVMQGTVPTEKAGQTMWKLSHCRQPFDVLIRTI